MPMKITYEIKVIVERDGPGFYAHCSALKGLHTYGDTKEQAFSNARDVAVAYLRSLIKHGDPIPLGVDEKRSIPERLPIIKRYCRRGIEEQRMLAKV